jgi:hypothetical protein
LTSDGGLKFKGNEHRTVRQFVLFQFRRPRQAAGMKHLLFVALACWTVVALGQNLDANYAADGRLIVTQFVTAPFPHSSRAEGHQYKDRFFPAEKHYRDSTVAIFIPKSFRATGPVDVVVHFHGWGNSVTGALSQFQLIQQFAASERNALLVVPEGPREASDSAGGKLRTQAALLDSSRSCSQSLGRRTDWARTLPSAKSSCPVTVAVTV